MNVFKLLDVIKEVDGDDVALVAAGNCHAALGLHPAANTGTHRLDDDVNVASSAGVFVERPERSPSPTRIIEVDRQLELDRAGLVDDRIDPAGDLAIDGSAVVPVAVIELDDGAVVGPLDAVLAQFARPRGEVVVTGAGERFSERCDGHSRPLSADQNRRWRSVTFAPIGPLQMAGIRIGSSSVPV